MRVIGCLVRLQACDWLFGEAAGVRLVVWGGCRRVIGCLVML